jgi:transposase
LAALRLATDQKKADKHGLTLSIWDESGFSFSPNCGGTWAPVGETPILHETSGRHNHTGVGMITRTSHRHLLQFRFTIFKGSACFEDFVFLLADLHRYYGRKVLVLWDHLPAHHAVESYFEDEHPDWFEFEYFPTYSPELNPVESCWNQMKNVYLSHYFPRSDEELVTTAHQVAGRINDERLLPSFFKYAGLKH